MYCYFWTLLGVTSIILTPSSSQQPSPLCLSMMERFDNIPPFCTQLQYRFNSTAYRINFTEAEVDSVCNSDICRDVMTDLVSSCFAFVSNHSRSVIAGKTTQYVSLYAGHAVAITFHEYFDDTCMCVDERGALSRALSMAPVVDL